MHHNIVHAAQRAESALTGTAGTSSTRTTSYYLPELSRRSKERKRLEIVYSKPKKDQAPAAARGCFLPCSAERSFGGLKHSSPPPRCAATSLNVKVPRTFFNLSFACGFSSKSWLDMGDYHASGLYDLIRLFRFMKCSHVFKARLVRPMVLLPI